ncbi:DUF7033 domain-containing protein [Pedobacter hartonius]|uniref:DUF7033 domain-containing protein n=1 Tax=Pedobacter hartonius TaxID=425514 RepID=A0A1H4FVT4_9SPHI|nr:hypothetical protein [Pedobacter hartonius]SEB01217.1 hypothetical protein SAMN05443550_108161 [Pedobacter hartonius]
MKLLVYVPLLTPRIKYIFNFIFNDILQTQVGFSSNVSEFRASDVAKITYGDQPEKDEPFFKQSDFLLSHTISAPTLKTTIFGDMIVPFAVDNSSLPFDVFAAAFYFVSRYEEYLPFKPGPEGNYPAEASLQSKLKLLEFPVIDGWALMLKNMLLQRYPKLYFGKKEFEFFPLICMYNSPEQASAFLSGQVMRLFKKLRLKLEKASIEPKISGLQLFLNEQHEKFNLNPVYFYRRTQELDMICEKQFSFPKSYLHLIKNGATKDFRMGYANTIGFRAGTCTPFFWYDLQLEKTTHLLVHPIAINDEILKLNRTFNIDDVLSRWGTLIENVKLLNGHFYLLWHKESLPEFGKGKVGRRLYQQLLANFLSERHDIRLK